MRKQATTSERYMKFLSTLAGRQRGFQNLGKVVSKNRLSSHAVTVLKNKNLVEKQANGIWKWSGPTPNPQMATAMVNEVNSIITGYVQRKKNASAPAKKSYTKRVPSPSTNGIPCVTKMTCSDTLSISSLKTEKEKLMARVAKIDTVLSVVDEFQNAN